MREERLLMMQGVAIGVLFSAVSAGVFYAAWNATVEYDADPGRATIGNQLMRRKSATMEDILDGMIYGNLQRVESAAKKMEAYGDTLGTFLTSSEYVDQDREFHASVSDLGTAAADDDLSAAKEATLRLERTCIECHALINQK